MMYSPTSGDADPMIEIDKTTDDDVEILKLNLKLKNY